MQNIQELDTTPKKRSSNQNKKALAQEISTRKGMHLMVHNHYFGSQIQSTPSSVGIKTTTPIDLSILRIHP